MPICPYRGGIQAFEIKEIHYSRLPRPDSVRNPLNLRAVMQFITNKCGKLNVAKSNPLQQYTLDNTNIARSDV